MDTLAVENLVDFFVSAMAMGFAFICANFAYSFIAGTSLEDKLKDFVGGDLEDDN
ncbi:MAG: hypothetical protein ACOVQ4_00425 [Flectobacillus sp.]|uniref:hypothetical protein n=1 Tax=Flectobacillus sp. TaxID=50419 RepID=UPI003B9B666F